MLEVIGLVCTVVVAMFVILLALGVLEVKVDLDD